MKYILICCSIMLMSCSSMTRLRKLVIVNEEVQISIPKKFVKLTLTVLEEKYKESPFKPNHEYINPKDSTIVSISYGGNPLTEDGVEKLRRYYEQTFKELYPQAVWINTETKEHNSLVVANMETMDDLNYQMIFFTAINGKQIYFVIQSAKENVKVVQPMARAILNSLEKK